MKPAATWLTRPRLTLTRTETSTKKTFITFGYSLVDRHPHRPQRQPRHRVQHLHRPQRRRVTECNANTNAYSYTYTHAYSYADTDPKTYSYSQVCSYAKGTTYAPAETLSSRRSVTGNTSLRCPRSFACTGPFALGRRNMEGRAPASLWDQRTFVGRRRAPPSTVKGPFKLVTKDPQILLDNFAVLD